MKVVLLESTRHDLIWFRRYYRSVFPEGGREGVRRFETALRTLADMPALGHVGGGDSREFSIARTPFLLIYRLRGDRVEVLRVWDGRSDRSREPGSD